MKCFACGRRVIEKPVEAIVDSKKAYFCCEHRATVYLQQSKKKKNNLFSCGCTGKVNHLYFLHKPNLLLEDTY